MAASPTLSWEHDRLESFLSTLPPTMSEAAALAERHDRRVSDPLVEYDGVAGNISIRHVLEPRHESFFSDSAQAQLRMHNVTLAASHSSRWLWEAVVLTDLMYGASTRSAAALPESLYRPGTAELDGALPSVEFGGM